MRVRNMFLMLLGIPMLIAAAGTAINFPTLVTEQVARQAVRNYCSDSYQNGVSGEGQWRSISRVATRSARFALWDSNHGIKAEDGNYRLFRLFLGRWEDNELVEPGIARTWLSDPIRLEGLFTSHQDAILDEIANSCTDVNLKSQLEVAIPFFWTEPSQPQDRFQTDILEWRMRRQAEGGNDLVDTWAMIMLSVYASLDTTDASDIGNIMLKAAGSDFTFDFSDDEMEEPEPEEQPQPEPVLRSVRASSFHGVANVKVMDGGFAIVPNPQDAEGICAQYLPGGGLYLPQTRFAFRTGTSYARTMKVYEGDEVTVCPGTGVKVSYTDDGLEVQVINN